ncbi:MAG TPA: DUF4136 domain-containing protein [bacterium]|nr:DUF4136 domain-containing protein [bacterium]
MRSLGLWTAIGVIALAGCAGSFVNTQYDRNTDFSRLKTYRWAVNEITPDPGFNMCVQNAVDEKLAAKGYQKKPSNGADFLIGAAAKIEPKMRTYRIDMGPRTDLYGDRARGSNYAAREWGHEWCYINTVHKVGTLALYVIDPATKKVLWEGAAEDIVDDDLPPEQRQQKAGQFIADILSKFPPK